MSDPKNATNLLTKVRNRLSAVSAAKRLHFLGLGGFAVAAVAVVAIRLGGLLPPEAQNLQWLLLVPAAVVLTAILLHRKVETQSAARAVDGFAGTNDLFLTLAALQNSAGEYQPLVLKTAEEKAQGIDASLVVPFRPQRSIGMQLVSLGVLALLILLLPTLDPFGRVEAAVKVREEQKEISNLLKSVKTRREQVAKKVQTAEDREQRIMKQAEELMQKLRSMKPAQKQSNSDALEGQRKQLNQMWKQTNSDELRRMLSENASQLFGSEQNRRMNEWLKDLQEGKTDGLQQKMDQAQETMQAMLNADTAEERQRLASQLRKELEEVRKFSSRKAGSKALENSLDSALKALEALAKQQEAAAGRKDGANNSEQSEMERQAREALEESLKMSKSELQELARSATDMKKLEDALKTLQQAQKLNQQGQLDGEQCEGCQTLEEYAQQYAKQMAGGTNGNAERTESGEIMDEDDSDPEGYRDEKSRSQIQAGKVLLSIRTREDATEKDFDPDDLRAYQNSVQAVKTGVQSAIEAEQIPPGYVDGIRGYFDKLQDSPD